jgi:hypothetical protein
MPTNLLQNGDFTVVPIGVGYRFLGSFSQTELENFVWSVVNTSNVSLQNNYDWYISPSSSTIYCSLQTTSSIQQSFTVTEIGSGSCTLSFFYSSRASQPFNITQIYINNVLFDTISLGNITRLTYYLKRIYLNVGVNTILFQSTSTSVDSAIGLANIQIYYSNDNNIKTTNVYGALTVYDYLPTGGTTTPGTLTTNQTLNFKYNSLPTYSANSLGYIYNYASAVTSVAAVTYINSSAFTIPVGVYYVTTYCRFTPSASSTYVSNLGLSSVTSLYTGYNYTTLNRLTASSLVSTLSQAYILNVTASTTLYFVFIASIAGNLNGSLNGKILRIA